MLALLAPTLLAASAGAATTSSSGAGTNYLLAVPYIDQAPNLDGHLDEDVWKRAAVATGFTDFQPIQEKRFSQDTTVYVYRDDRNLYIGWDCKDVDPEHVRATYSDRDNVFNDDWVMVGLDPFDDRRLGLLLTSNAFGIQGDLTHDDLTGNEDSSWDMVFFTAGARNAHGYQVEMALPFGSLRFNPARDRWGINFVRFRARNGEKASWKAIRAEAGGLLAQEGEISGMQGIPVSVSTEVIPELTGRAGPGADTQHALFTSRHGPWGGGKAADAGITAKLTRAGDTLDLTVNPDFSQVESDAAQITVNQRFALFYPEKRPFFLEGRALFNTPEQILYTRSIFDPLYGIKLTGNEENTNFAILNAVDRRPPASLVDPRWTPDTYGHDANAETTAIRAASNLSPDITTGVTFVDKHIGPAWNRVGGIDESVRLFQSWSVVGQALASATDHPDGSYGTGGAGKVTITEGTRHVFFQAIGERVDNGFRAEAGYIPRVGFAQGSVLGEYRFETGRKTGLQAWRMGDQESALGSSLNSDRTMDHNPYVKIEFPTNFLLVDWDRGYENFADTPFWKSRWDAQGNGTPATWLDYQFTINAGDEINYDVTNAFLGRSAVANVAFDFQPLPQARLSVSYNRKALVRGDVGDALRQFATRSSRDRVFDASVARVATQVFFTPFLSARAIVDYDNEAGKAIPSLLLSYRPGPGTILYAGGQLARPTKSQVDVAEDSAVFVKLAWLFRY